LDYINARRSLERLPSLEVKPGLERVRRLLDYLDNPQLTYPAIHITGTNGKGSVVAMLSSVLKEAGYKVGRFTSPDLIDFRDRISVDGEWISKQEFAQQVTRISPLLEDTEDLPSLFEVLTAVAFSHFAVQKVDLAVVEVGLGGRYDATNVLMPILTILTTVAMDHTAILGNSLEKIAWEKAGIAKEGVTLLAGNLPAQAERVARQECLRVHATFADTSNISLERSAHNLQYASYKVTSSCLPPIIKIPLIASYEQENLHLALAAILELKNKGIDIDDSAIISGLAATAWPGRFEVMSNNPLIVLDGAHNPSAAKAITREVQELFPVKERRHLLFGVLNDKDYDSISRLLFALFAHVTLTQSCNPRALPTGPLSQIAVELGISHLETDSVVNGLSAALHPLQQTDALLITGSLSIVREARPALLARKTLKK
jgi:dihydrofolate synthase / folylpolyglutamate synthase